MIFKQLCIKKMFSINLSITLLFDCFQKNIKKNKDIGIERSLYSFVNQFKRTSSYEVVKNDLIKLANC